MGRERIHETVVGLLVCNGISGRRITAALQAYSHEALSRMPPLGLCSVLGRNGLGEDVAEALSRAPAVLSEMERVGDAVSVLGEKSYPVLLAEIPDPPPAVFVRGDFDPGDDKTVAVVGSRRSSLAGLDIAGEIARGLAELGFTVVSGLARGIDTAAHRGALKAGGRTVAVLGSGLDVIYPGENANLARSVASCGGLLSELPPGSQPLPHNFPRRNRLISGLARGVVVVEATARSGALITARCALEQNRSVFAVPGTPGLPGSGGTNDLIRQGAILVESAEEVVEDLGPQLLPAPGPETVENDSGEGTLEQRILDLLSGAPAHVDELCRAAGLGMQEALGLLLSLEARGLVRSMPGKFYTRETRSR
jgi:DNA processing protein